MWINCENLRLKEYAHELLGIIPVSVYEGLGSVFCLGAVIFTLWKGGRKGAQYTALLALLEYVTLIYCSTVFCRTAMAERRYDFHPLWSYKAIETGRTELMAENIMNMMVFIPIGLLMTIAFPNIKWWGALMIGFFLSVGIEALQFFFMKGFSEVDDMMHNTFGCLIGITLVSILMLMIRKMKKQ